MPDVRGGIRGRAVERGEKTKKKTRLTAFFFFFCHQVSARLLRLISVFVASRRVGEPLELLLKSPRMCVEVYFVSW